MRPGARQDSRGENSQCGNNSGNNDAEAVLRARISSVPDDVLARLNLAIVLWAQGDEVESARLASELADSLGESGMGKRARELASAS